MKSNNEIKSRIKVVKETSQITKAMKLISTIKLKRALVKFEANKIYNRKLRKSIVDIFSSGEEFENHYSIKREGGRIAYIVIASDKGLAGDYNHKVLDLAYEDMKNVKEKYVFTIGHIAIDYFTHKGIEVDNEYQDIIENPLLADARNIMYNLLDMYNNNFIDEIRLVYTSMLSFTTSAPTVDILLPFHTRDEYLQEFKTDSEEQKTDYRLNGNSGEVIDTIVEQYILGIIYSALIQSVMAENYKRMVAMDSATRNSKEMLEKLSIEFNKIRQEKITTEITETSVSLLRKE
ncbi:MAG TPA: ATP synthase F1 subunit gamma [Clostridia bacterium]|nr:ATP synthase F1 subunit gamma [Clostridia bacterium]